MKDTSSGALGILGMAGAVILFLVLRKFFPTLSTILLVVFGIILLLIILLVILVIYFSRQKPKEKEGSRITEDTEAVLARGRSNLMEIRRLQVQIRNQQIRTLSEEICRVADKILRTLKSQPEDIPGVRQFLNYYLPTLGNILLKYERVEKSGIPTDNMEENVIDCLEKIKNAMDRQYANLFNNDILDLSVEMEVLTQACKRDGLLTDEDVQGTKEGVKLTL
ncbi:MAG: 5-bromo-4-chloroindolyl phosphate hydrolysis family protein [Lachnospiraceae bacterium]|nr:5-bromo-4-chloroindolyl phosphate hydrolysis family protein [Lachnospiraceae bacterium]MCI7596889.1 5-bromo-4-chloroindolyl phosphate hydrolysis family protein [Lachnospiraceae bacterium]MDD7050088.1 5-bromo-4-chloroindolyl phosphate hydrolysis family protein [Lachnospiraceae bacterium]MDY4097544.1 5-bromo-4-chloroindolyl phosphate hydrolysis family protein [Lachnospiraceae bacterium]